MGYNTNLFKRSVRDGAKVGAVVSGLATGAATVGAIYHFAPYVLGATILGGPEVIAAAHVGVFLAGTLPGAAIGYGVGGLLLSPVLYGVNYATQKRLQDSTVKDTLSQLETLKTMPDAIIKAVIEDIVYKYSEKKSINASHSSRDLLKQLKSRDHLLNKLQIIEDYIKVQEGSVSANNGKKLFRMINDSIGQLDFDHLAQLPGVSQEKTKPDSDYSCPVYPTRPTYSLHPLENKIIRDPVRVIYKHGEISEEMVVDRDNFDAKRGRMLSINFEEGTLEVPKNGLKTDTAFVETMEQRGYFKVEEGRSFLEWLKSFFVRTPKEQKVAEEKSNTVIELQPNSIEEPTAIAYSLCAA